MLQNHGKEVGKKCVKLLVLKSNVYDYIWFTVKWNIFASPNFRGFAQKQKD